MEKDLRRLHVTADKLRALPQLNASERLVYAICLLSSPDERWMMNAAYQRSATTLSYFEFVLASKKLLE